MFTQKDIQQLGTLGITEQAVQEQLAAFVNGFPYLNIAAPALIGKGIMALSPQQQSDYEQQYDEFSGTTLKFVPASGAATRMFKQLFEYKDAAEKQDLNNPKHKAVKEFFDRLGEFAFYDLLKQKLSKQEIDAAKPLPNQYPTIVATLLNEDGLSYGQLPKAMLKFHKYPNESRTAIEEHLVEAALYACGSNREARLHFTVSAEHREGLEALLNQVLSAYEQRFGIRFHITFSEQKKSTDTIAVDMDNQPFRNADGSLLFRPGGHGALIDNLNEQTEELVFIKNIDNIVPETKVGETVRWKKVLAGTLLSCRNRAHSYLCQLDNGVRDTKLLNEIADFLQSTFCISLPDSLSEERLAAFLYEKLNRPMRVCGMVKNEGEPGGGPFLVTEEDGSTSLQILESSQINMKDERMKACFDASSHFNPVDLVCTFRNHKGEKYDLRRFVDPQTGFISEKSKDGKPLKAQELPGLWNGAMSRWNTLFVEVPLATFNPVKTVNDLLRKEHQA